MAIGAIVGAVGSLAGGLLANKGAKKAAQAQAHEADKARAHLEHMYNLGRRDRRQAVTKVGDILTASQNKQSDLLQQGLSDFQDLYGQGTQGAVDRLTTAGDVFQSGIEGLQAGLTPVYDEAGQLISGGYEDAIGTSQDVLNRQLGLAGGLQGISGSQFGNYFQDAIGTLSEGLSEGALQRRQDRAAEALNRQLFARGKGLGGAAIESQAQLAQNIGDQFEQERLANAQNLANLALGGANLDLGAATAGANLGSQALGAYGSNVSGLQTGLGTASAGNLLEEARIQNQLGQTGLQAGLQNELTIGDIERLGATNEAQAVSDYYSNLARLEGERAGTLSNAELAAAQANAAGAQTLGQGLSNISLQQGRALGDSAIQQANALTGALSGIGASVNQYFQGQRQDANLDKILAAMNDTRPVQGPQPWQGVPFV